MKASFTETASVVCLWPTLWVIEPRPTASVRDQAPTYSWLGTWKRVSSRYIHSVRQGVMRKNSSEAPIVRSTTSQRASSWMRALLPQGMWPGWRLSEGLGGTVHMM